MIRGESSVGGLPTSTAPESSARTRPRLDIPLDPDLRSDEVVRVVLRHLRSTIRENTPGTIHGRDPEHLHDFRVAVRRTRSALGQMKQVFPRRPADRFKRGFSALGKVTGPRRDLDVFLAKFGKYTSSLSREDHADLEPVRRHVHALQQIEQRVVARALRSARHKNLTEAWDRFLSTPGAERARIANARRPIREVAVERTRIAFDKVMHRGGAIDDSTPATSLHRLRIDCKKLRYLLELFRRLHDPETVSRFVADLKRLQDLLGDFNDLDVHQRLLMAMSDTIARDAPRSRGPSHAIGRLVQCLSQLQIRERDRFGERFAEFAGPESLARADILLRGGQNASDSS